ncbi:hypothetical protein ACSU64_03350 [Bacillaceae bacterium C204]|uniref:hypothetical protein n=1 Tax=Neobacillus sp. 204 TaxID=3383351 RepID=UPI00397CE3E8
MNNSAPVRVIVEFKQSPAEIAVLQEQVAGNDLSLKEAKQDVNNSHKLFKEFIQKMVPEKAGVNAISTFGYTPSTEASSHSTKQSEIQITNEYKRAFNGVASKG